MSRTHGILNELFFSFLLTNSSVHLLSFSNYVHFHFEQMLRNKISDIPEGRVLELLHQGYSQSRIMNILKLNEINISQPTLSNVKRKVGRQRNSGSKIKNFRTKSPVPASIVDQAIKNIDIDNPLT